MKVTLEKSTGPEAMTGEQKIVITGQPVEIDLIADSLQGAHDERIQKLGTFLMKKTAALKGVV
jgi:hypothetical protein